MEAKVIFFNVDLAKNSHTVSDIKTASKPDIDTDKISPEMINKNIVIVLINCRLVVLPPITIISAGTNATLAPPPKSFTCSVKPVILPHTGVVPGITSPQNS